MQFNVVEGGTWYHGSDKIFDTLEIGSTITQWKDLAEAFSHKPPRLCYSDNGDIIHNGQEIGYLYIIDEPITINKDIKPHPRTTMDSKVEFLTNRSLSVKLVKELNPLNESEINRANEEFERVLALQK